MQLSFEMPGLELLTEIKRAVRKSASRRTKSVAQRIFRGAQDSQLELALVFRQLLDNGNAEPLSEAEKEVLFEVFGEQWTIQDIYSVHENLLVESVRLLLDGRATDFNRGDVITWMRRDDTDGPFSWDASCRLCGMDPDDFRNMIETRLSARFSDEEVDKCLSIFSGTHDPLESSMPSLPLFESFTGPQANARSNYA